MDGEAESNRDAIKKVKSPGTTLATKLTQSVCSDSVPSSASSCCAGNGQKHTVPPPNAPSSSQSPHQQQQIQDQQQQHERLLVNFPTTTSLNASASSRPKPASINNGGSPPIHRRPRSNSGWDSPLMKHLLSDHGHRLVLQYAKDRNWMIQEETPGTARELLREQGLFSSTDHISGDLERLIMDAFLEEDDERLHMLTLRMADRPSFALGAVFSRDLTSQEMTEWITPSGALSPAARDIARISSGERWEKLRSSLRQVIAMASVDYVFPREFGVNDPKSKARSERTDTVMEPITNPNVIESGNGHTLFDSWIKIELVVTHVEHLGARVGTVLLSLALTRAVFPPTPEDKEEEEEEQPGGCLNNGRDTGMGTVKVQRTKRVEAVHVYVRPPATHAILHAAGGEGNLPAVRLYRRLGFWGAPPGLFSAPCKNVFVLAHIKEALAAVDWDEVFGKPKPIQ